MLLLAAVALLVAAAPAQAATFRVTGPNDTTLGCTGTQCPSIRSAITAAAFSAGSDTIVVPAGEYHLTFGQLLVDTPVNIVGEGARRTTIHGRPIHPWDGGFRVLEVSSGVDASVSGVTLAEGYGLGRSPSDTFFAGGIIKNSGTLSLDRVRVTGGHGSSGGGIANTGGKLTLERSLIDGNRADDGGGDGGALLNFNGGTLTVRNSTIAANTAIKGGALFTWSDNGEKNTTEFEHVTVIGNRDGVFGGLHHDAEHGDILRLRATVVAGNTRGTEPRNCAAPVETLGHNVSNTAECDLAAETDRQAVDVRYAEGLENAGGDTDVWPVAADSPAVNLIPSCTGADQRGVSRPQGAGCDAGAYEHDPVRIESGPEGFTTDNSPMFEFSGADHYTCALTSQEEVPCTSPAGSAEILPDNDYIFRLTGLDGENQVIGRVERAITIDTRPPEPPVITSPANGATVAEVVLSGTGEPFATISVREPEGERGRTVADVEGNWTVVVEGEQGQRTYFARATDRAGNISEDGPSITLNVIEPPVATITNDPPTLTNNVHFVFEFTADVPEATFECRDFIPVNEPGDWVGCTSPHTLRDLTDGVHIFEVRAALSGVPGEPAVHEFRVDTDPPEPPAITEPENGRVLRDEPLRLEGTTEPLTAVDVYDDGVLLGPAMIITEGSGGWFYDINEPSEGTHVFTAVTKDDAGNASQPSAPVTVYVHPNGPSASIEGPALTNDATPTFKLNTNEPDAFIECALDGVSYQPCESPVTVGPLAEGQYTLTVRPTGADNVSGTPVSHEFRVDLTPPGAPQVSGSSAGNTATFTVASGEEGVTLECRLEGPGQPDVFVPCSGQQHYTGLAPGSYRFVVRASDRAGNLSETVREFTVASVQPQITPTPTPTATPAPQPEFRETAVARPVSGKVLVRRPGSNEFVELDGSESIPLGSTIDAKRGRVRITAETRQGRAPQRAEFYRGIFRITQTRTVVDLRLVEALNCSSRRNAAAAQRKPKKRRLWGSGKGKFRTTGSYSAATVRGTTWLVEDTCTTTLTRVTQGVVAVRDKRLKKTVLVRKGKRYIARARR
jgi:hypothetical protein